MENKNLWNMLQDAAASNTKNGVVFLVHQVGAHGLTELRHQYYQIWKDARERSLLLGPLLRKQKKPIQDREQAELQKNKVVVLHFDSPLESICWFWAVIAAGAIPCISLPFKGTPNDRYSYILGLRDLLEDPLIITTKDLRPLFPSAEHYGLRMYSIEKILKLRRDPEQDFGFPGAVRTPDDIAVILLTSGSTGQPKAVGLKHGQILSSIEGKTRKHKTTCKDTLLSWTDFSHVANLFEIHLHAVSRVACQIQIVGDEIVANPVKLLELIHEYRVSYTFAPNFLLTSLLKSFEVSKPLGIAEDWAAQYQEMSMSDVLNVLSMENSPISRLSDVSGKSMNLNVEDGQTEYRTDYKFNLKCLRALISGGESNVVETCQQLTKILQVYGAPASFIRPGFGMTETCAGCIYSLDCPRIDAENSNEFASLGEPIVNTQMRLVDSDDCVVKGAGTGKLQLNGLAVFDGYYKNEVATRESFTDDGWFETGDVARIDEYGHLHLVGRVKDTIVINGVNHYPHAIEAALDKAGIDGMKPTFTAIFPTRPTKSGTEAICIVYAPTYDHKDVESRVNTLTAILKVIIQYSGVRPFVVIPLPERLLQKSTLGKLSRSAIRISFEKGAYNGYLFENSRLIRGHQQTTSRLPTTSTEKIVLRSYAKLFSTSVAELGVDSNFFSLGVSSIDLLQLRVDIRAALGVEFPITLFFSHTTIKDFAQALDSLDTRRKYDPVVVLQPNGNKTPIFFIHPGMGEVLIFMNLARHITDRPVYTLRARGFDGEPYFGSMEEIITEYHAAIKRVQPTGPYALAGYSFGSILTFEITKRMQVAGDEVKFLATFDQPPHFKMRSRGYDWYDCVLSLGFFLSLIPENYAYAEMDHLRKVSHDRVLAHILALAPEERVRELGMNTFRLDNWAKLALEMKKITWNYDPAGLVPHMDIFYTVPLLGIVKAKSTEEWRYDCIGKWDEFVTKPAYHFVSGGHRTLINPPHLVSFQKLFKKVLEERGL